MPTNIYRMRKRITDPGTAEAIADIERQIRQVVSNNTLGAGSVNGTTVGTIDGTVNIIAGTITAQSIAAGSITVLALQAGIIDAYLIDGQTIDITSNLANTNKISMDAINGIRGYDSGGNLNFTLDTFGNFTSKKGTITGGIIQTAGGSMIGTISPSKVMMDSTGFVAFDDAGNEVFNIDTHGNVGLWAGSTGSSSLTLGQLPPGTSGARIVLNSAGIKGWNASNVLTFNVDATTGLITCTGVITAQTGSQLPVNVIVGDLPGSANRYSDSAFQDGQTNFSATTANGTWVGSACSISDGGTTVPPVYGARTAKITASGANAYVYDNAGVTSDLYKRVLPGLNYTWSHYVWPSSVARIAHIDVSWYNSSGTLLSTSVGDNSTPPTGQWTRVQQTFQAPSSAAFGIAHHYVSSGGGIGGDIFYIECFQMEQGDRASAWAPRPDEILYNSINANMIQAGSVTATAINVTNLAAINANLGTITSGTLISALIKTSSTATTTGGAIFNSTGLYAYDSSGGLQVSLDSFGLIFSKGSINIGGGVFQVDSAGNVTATSATLTGNITATGGTISGTLTVTGGFQTASSGARVIMDSSGIKAYNSSNVLQVQIKSSDGTLSVGAGGIVLSSSGITSTGFNTNNVGQVTSDLWLGTGSGASPRVYLDGPTICTIQSDSLGNMVYNMLGSTSHIWEINGSVQMSLNTSSLALADGQNFSFGTTTGTMIGTTASQKIGFFGQGGHVQPIPVGATGVSVAGGALAAIFRDTTVTGGSGSTAYGLGDIVRCLKQLGLIQT